MTMRKSTPSFFSCFGVARVLSAAFAATLALAWTSPCLAETPATPATDLDEELEAAPSRWDRLKSLIADAVTPEVEEVDKVGANTRGDETIILADPYRDGTDKPNKLTADKRDLHVRWQGGEGPYRLNLMKKENDGTKTPVIQETSTQERQVDLSQVDLKPGTYILVIKDQKAFAENPDPAYGPAVMMDLEVLPPEARPSMPQELADASCSQNLKQFLYASWLARQGDGEWTLEAIQLVKPLLADSKKATTWMEQWGGK